MLLHELKPKHFRLAHKEKIQECVDRLSAMDGEDKAAYLEALRIENELFDKAVLAKTNDDIEALFVEYNMHDLIEPFVAESVYELHYRIEQSLKYNKELLSVFDDSSSVSSNARRSFTSRYPKMSKIAANRNARSSFTKVGPEEGQFSSKKDA